MMRDTYTLLGLDDNVNTIRDIRNLTLNDSEKICFELNEFEKPKSINILTDKNLLANSETRRILGRICMIGDTNDLEKKIDNNFNPNVLLDEKTRFLQVYNGGGIFQDTVGNTIILIQNLKNEIKIANKVTKNPYIQYFQNGYFGNQLGTNAVNSKAWNGTPDSRLGGNGGARGYYLVNKKVETDSGSRWWANYIKDWINGKVNPVRDALNDSSLKGIINVRKVDSPIIIHLYRADVSKITFGTILPIISILADVGATFLGIPPGVVSGLIATGTKIYNKQPLNSQDFANIKAGLDYVGVGDSKYTDSALKFATGDKQALIKELGQGASDWVTTKLALDKNQLAKFQPALKSAQALYQANQIAQNYRDFETQRMSNIPQNSNDSAYLNIKNSDVKKSDYLTNINVMVNGGGNPQLLLSNAVSPYGETSIKNLAQKPEYQGADKLLALMNAQNGLPMGDNVMNQILLTQLEQQASQSTNKQIILPAGLSLESQQCFSNMLKTKGFTILANIQTLPNDLNVSGKKLIKTRNYYNINYKLV